MNNKIIKVFIFILFVLALNLWLEFKLLEWYREFYDSIIKKEFISFGMNIILFFSISIGISACTSIFSFLSEYLDMYLKIKFSSTARENYSTEKINKNINQKLIDDATMAAEKFAILMPMYILNIAKAFATFIAIGYWAPSVIKIIYINAEIYYPLHIASIFFVLTQIIITGQYYPLAKRVDKIKRRAENNFRMKIISQENILNITQLLERYLNVINLIRRHSAKKNFILSITLGCLSSISYIVPFFILFSLFYFDEMTFGELMRLSATFGFFQNAIGYLLLNYKELSRGIAAYKRVVSC